MMFSSVMSLMWDFSVTRLLWKRLGSMAIGLRSGGSGSSANTRENVHGLYTNTITINETKDNYIKILHLSMDPRVPIVSFYLYKGPSINYVTRIS